METQKIKISDITFDKKHFDNSRLSIKDAELAELMESIKVYGLLEPIGVTKLPDREKYSLIYGNRRLAAVKKLGWKEVHAVIKEDSEDNFLLNLTENLQRKNLNIYEEGIAYLKLRERGLTNKEIKARIGVSVARINSAVLVAKQTPEKFRDKVVAQSPGKKRPGTISASDFETVSRVKKTFGLKAEEAEKILTFSMKDESNCAKVNQIARMVKEGIKVDVAIKKVDELKVLTLKRIISKDNEKKIREKYGMTPTAYIHHILDGFELLKHK